MHHFFTSMIEKTHQRVFGHAISTEMRQFLHQLSWSFVGGIIASLLMFIVTISAGRWLGPSIYGQYNVLFSFANTLSSFFLLGLGITSVRYLADPEYKNQQREIFTTTLASVTAVTIIVSGVIIASQPSFLLRNATNQLFLVWGSGFAAVIAYKSLFHGYLRAFHLIKEQSYLRVIDALITLIILGGVAYGGQAASSTLYALALIGGGTTFILLAFILLRKNLSRYNGDLLRRMIRDYSKFLLIGTFLEAVRMSDRFVMSYFVPLADIGIYSAYYAASHSIIDELGLLFLNVFWPTAIKHNSSMTAILAKSQRIFITFSPLWISLAATITIVFIWFFGQTYTFEVRYILIFAINAYLSFLYLLHINLLNIHHVRTGLWVNGFFFVLPLLILIVTHSIIGYVIAQIILQTSLIAWTRRYLNQRNGK